MVNSPLIRGHHAGDYTVWKVLQSGYYSPNLFKDSYKFVKRRDQCQRQGSISKHHEMPMAKMIEIELFDIWGIDFMGPFVSSYGLKYILVAWTMCPNELRELLWLKMKSKKWLLF